MSRFAAMPMTRYHRSSRFAIGPQTPLVAHDATILRGILSTGVHDAREIWQATTTSRARPPTVDRRGRVERLVAVKATDLQLLSDREFDFPLSCHKTSSSATRPQVRSPLAVRDLAATLIRPYASCAGRRSKPRRCAQHSSGHRGGRPSRIATPVTTALEAADRLARDGIEIEVIDLRSVVPLDVDHVVRSVRTTERLLVVDEDYLSFGLTGEVITRVIEALGPAGLRAVGRHAVPDVPIPAAITLERAVIPSPDSIAAAVRRVLAL